MINGKHINYVTAILICLSIAACALIVYAANNNDANNVTEYQKKLFSGEVAEIDIQVDAAEWQSMLDNASAKEYVSGDLIINGERFGSVGIRTKGNSSLTQVASSESDRYSLQFKMNHYVKGQTYYGLDSFCVNNMMGDATYMKDYISYDIMDYIGVSTPLKSYAHVTVNGEAYGFFILLERYEKAFLDREYNTSAGNLYNVKIQMGQRDNFMQGGMEPDNMAENFNQRGGMGGFGMGGSGGGSLIYNGDDPDSYSSIFLNSEFNITDADKQRVITAIKNLNEGENLEKYFDVDEILRYLAAHTFVVNLDSYLSNMQQNYYIYERDGKISILPWDYGLSFGGFQSGSASDVVNFPIDTPVSGVNIEDRPLINELLNIDEYREKYHGYLRQIAEGYFESGIFESVVNELDSKISEYVKNDATAFYNYEQYKASIPVFLKLGALRAESVLSQLDGSVPSTTSGQKEDAGSLIDASSINLSSLGTMGGGGGGQNRGMFQPPEMPDGFPPFGGDNADGFPPFGGDNADGFPPFMGDNADGFPQGQNRPDRQNRNADINGNNSLPAFTGAANEQTGSINWILYGLLLLLLTGVILFMAFYKRRRMES